MRPPAATTAASSAVLRRRLVGMGARGAHAQSAAALSRRPSSRAARRVTGRRSWVLLPVRQAAQWSAPAAVGCGSNAGCDGSAPREHGGARCAPIEPCSARARHAVIIITASRGLWPSTDLRSPWSRHTWRSLEQAQLPPTTVLPVLLALEAPPPDAVTALTLGPRGCEGPLLSAIIFVFPAALMVAIPVLLLPLELMLTSSHDECAVAIPLAPPPPRPGTSTTQESSRNSY